jgi:predicted DNA-binding transcriptional regulator AlpA
MKLNTSNSSESLQGKPLLHNVKDSCTLLGMSRSSVERLRKKGAFPNPVIQRGRLVLFSLSSLQLFASNGVI